MHSIYSQFNTPQLILIGRENFAVWKLAMEALLQVKGLWGCVIGDPVYKEDTEKDSLARTLIVLSIESFNYHHVQDTKTAKEAWDRLENVFGGSGLARKVGLLRGLVPTQLVDFPSLEEYIDSITTSSLKLRDMGFEVSDEWIGVQLLAGLTNEYWPLIVELDSRRAVITGDYVKNVLLDNIDTKSSNKMPEVTNKEVEVKELKLSNVSPELYRSADILKSDHKTSPSVGKNSQGFYDNYRESTCVPESWQQDRSSISGNSSGSALSPSSSIKKEDLEVEVRGEHGGYHEAFVSDLFDCEVELTFDSDWQSRARFAYEDVRLAPRRSVKPDIRKGQEIEVYTRVDKKSRWGWWRARIDTIMGNGYLIVEIPGWLGSKFGHGECVPLERIRASNKNPCIDHRTFHKREISVPEEQRESARQENVHKEFQRAIGAAICRYVPERGVLLLISRNDNLESLSSWLDEMHFGNNRSEDPSCFSRRLGRNDSYEPLLSNYS